MNEQMVEQVVQLVRDGGAAGVWMWMVWIVSGLVKFGIGMSVLFYVLRSGIGLAHKAMTPAPPKSMNEDLQKVVVKLGYIAGTLINWPSHCREEVVKISEATAASLESMAKMGVKVDED